MKKLAVYFTNGMKAYFAPGTMILLNDKDVTENDPINDIVVNNATAVNWKTVCFIRVIDDKGDEED